MKEVLFTISLLVAPLLCRAQSGQPCPRFTEGSAIQEPENLYSEHGVLEVTFRYQTRIDNARNTLYCFTSGTGVESPTLHLHPGETLIVHLKNELRPGAMMTMAGVPEMAMSSPSADNCGTSAMTSSSVNIHYHGTNVPPTCHQDEVIKTAVDGGGSFDYRVEFPGNEPPGLYWYHPHIHGISEPAVLGGASGAIVIEGLENINPVVAKLPQRVLIVRDNLVPGNPAPGGRVPSWDLSVNYTPVSYPDFTPGVLKTRAGERQLWRVLNASADTILDLELDYDDIAQALEVVGLDGVPTGSQDGTSQGKTLTLKQILLPPASRAEFIVTTPSLDTQSAVLKTRKINTGPDGDNDPERPLVNIRPAVDAPAATTMPNVSAPPGVSRFANLAMLKPGAHRELYFSEVLSDPNNPASPTNFYITVDGQQPTLFNPANPPAIQTTQGAVEDWTIENRTLEIHEFHIHQIHFLVLEQNGVSIKDGQFLDTVQVPYWSGTGPYPSVKVRMDFRGQIAGDFVYHCHILGHEDGGMMAVIRVNPAP